MSKSKPTDYKRLWRQCQKAFIVEYNANTTIYGLLRKILDFIRTNCTPELYKQLLTELSIKEPNDSNNPVRK